MAAGLLALLAQPLLSAPQAGADTAPPDATLPTTVGSTPLPTAQINGVVWTQLVVGNKVFVGGSFTSARPAGSPLGVDETPRANLLAYDLQTGVLDTSFAPVLNGQVYALAASPDGQTLYVGGQFTTVSGSNRYRVAAFNVGTGDLTSFAPTVNATVQGLAVTADAVYMVGPFTSVKGVSRTNAAALTRSAAAVLPWAPAPANGSPSEIVVSPDASKVVLGGSFTTMNGSGNPGYGLAMVDSAAGASLPMPVNALIRNGNTSSGITSLSARADGFYGSGYSYSRNTGNLEGSFRSDWNGNLVWMEDCHGDTYSVYSSGEAVYVAGHPHYCGNVGAFPQTATWTFQRALAFTDSVRGTISREPLGYYNFEGNPRPEQLHFYPDINVGSFTGQDQGPWSVSGSGDYVVYGGEFTKVNGVDQQGLVRFAKNSVSPSTDGPTVTSSYLPTVKAYDGGRARVSWSGVEDRDNYRVTYALIRDGVVGSPIYQTQGSSTWWNTAAMGYLETGLQPGETHTYRLKVTDPDGNSRYGGTTSFTYQPGPVLTAYDKKILADTPGAYWSMNETSGTAVADATGSNNAVKVSSVVTGVSAPAGIGGTAFRFNSTSSKGGFAGQTKYSSPNRFSAEVWFKTTTNQGGSLVNLGSSTTGTSGTADRLMYLDNSGRLFFGTNAGQGRTINSTATYRNNAWHHAVAVLDPSGMKLFVDGALVASRADTPAGANFDGYWRVGGDRTSAWPSTPSSQWFAGDLDAAAIYRYALTPAQIQAHYTAGINPPAINTPPVANIVATDTDLKVAVDGSGSSDPDGTVAAYAWNFGDGATATGESANHTYAAGGTYTVTLTVTDDGGATDSATKSVTVQPANQLPTAAFTLSSTGLKVDADGSDSTDPDGTIASYAWDFGDGSTGTGVSPTHTYAAAGTYLVELTVTDNRDGTATTSHAISVPTGQSAYALDEFNRTQATGWGTADVGGAWTVSAASGFEVNGTTGLVKVPTGSTRTANLTTATKVDSDVSLSFAADKATTGGGVYYSVTGRRVAANLEYRVNARVLSTGSVVVSLAAFKGTATSTNLTSQVTIPGTVAAGTAVNVRLQTTGTGTTTIRAKVWIEGQPEPAGWTVTATDTFADLQVAGHAGLTVYLSGSTTNGPFTVTVPRFAAVEATP